MAKSRQKIEDQWGRKLQQDREQFNIPAGVVGNGFMFIGGNGEGMMIGTITALHYYSPFSERPCLEVSVRFFMGENLLYLIPGKDLGKWLAVTCSEQNPLDPLHPKISWPGFLAFES